MVGSPNPSTRAASCSSTHRAASNGRERVSAATRRVFHGATSPASTFAQSRGSRCRRSRASAISDIAACVETPIAAPSSSATNAATPGEPSPPREASQSTSPGRPASPQVAVPDSDGGGVLDAPLVRDAGASPAGPRGRAVRPRDPASSTRASHRGPRPRSPARSLPPWTHSTRDHRQSNPTFRHVQPARKTRISTHESQHLDTQDTLGTPTRTRRARARTSAGGGQRQPSSGATWRSRLSSTCAL